MAITEPSHVGQAPGGRELRAVPGLGSAVPVARGTQLALEQLGFELQGPLLGGFEKIISTVNP